MRREEKGTKEKSFCQLCVSLGESSFSALESQVKKLPACLDLVEIRLDKLCFPFDITQLQTLEQQVSCPIIWTLRTAFQGGDFQGDEQEYFKTLQTLLLQFKPAWMDLEAHFSSSIIKALQKLSPDTQWIISWHNDKETPLDLESIYQKMRCHAATYYKLVTFARTTTDALRMLNFSSRYPFINRQLCGFCMGERGQITRILSPLVGNPLTYAYLEKGKETAPGQLTVEELIHTYRFREMNQETQLLGLIGRPVDQSVSQVTHNAVLKELALNAVYVKFYLENSELPSFFKEINSLPIKGLSVTMPFKEQVLSLLQSDQTLKACNTLRRNAQGWQGTNTDGQGALKALHLSSLQGIRIVILGAGGTAQAIAQAAHQQGAQLTILNRTVERARCLAQPLQAQWGSLDQLPQLKQTGYNYLIQTTSVGMTPNINETLVPIDWIAQEACVFDVISNPCETRFLKEARAKGMQTISGQELFIHQAVEQFIYWFGHDLSRTQIEQIIRQKIPKTQSIACVRVSQSVLQGEVQLPPSKSHTIRAILLAAMTQGTSLIHHVLESPDVVCAKKAACQFGAKVKETSTGLAITGVAGAPQTPQDVIEAGNSGQVLRFAGALAALSTGYTTITGDESIRSNRPIQPLIEGLKGLNAWAESKGEKGFAPLIVKGPIQAGKTQLKGQDSQPVSALMMAAAFTEGKTEIEVQEAGEKPWLALTLSWLDRLKVSYTHRNLEHFTIQGQQIRPSFEVTIPGDLSSLAFPLIAALITQSELVIHHVDMQDVQGDKALIFLLQAMGACLQIDNEKRLLRVPKQGKLKGCMIDVNGFIDAVPILAVLGCYMEGETQLVNAAIARHKESDRLKAITTELKKMGAWIEETEEGLKVRSSSLKGAVVKSYADHRIAMSLIVAGLGAIGVTEVQGIECIAKSYPHFIKDLKRIGAKIHGDIN